LVSFLTSSFLTNTFTFTCGFVFTTRTLVFVFAFAFGFSVTFKLTPAAFICIFIVVLREILLQHPPVTLCTAVVILVRSLLTNRTPQFVRRLARFPQPGGLPDSFLQRQPTVEGRDELRFFQGWVVRIAPELEIEERVSFSHSCQERVCDQERVTAGFDGRTAAEKGLNGRQKGLAPHQRVEPFPSVVPYYSFGIGPVTKEKELVVEALSSGDLLEGRIDQIAVLQMLEFLILCQDPLCFWQRRAFVSSKGKRQLKNREVRKLEERGEGERKYYAHPSATQKHFSERLRRCPMHLEVRNDESE
jgi:hypothetical protein